MEDSEVQELVLRGKALEHTEYGEEGGVLVHVLWGKYAEDAGAVHEGFGLQMEDYAGMVKRIPDLSTDAGAICLLAERMNRYRISRYHIDDVIADFLAAV